jgi:hypothetical protein
MGLDSRVEPNLSYVRHATIEGTEMPISRLIEKGSFERVEIERLQKAYEITLKQLHLVDRNDPLTELVAKKIIEIGGNAVDNPAQLSARAINELGLPYRA